MGTTNPAQQQQSCTELAITGQMLATPPRANPAQLQQNCAELAITGQKLPTPARAKPPPAMDIDTAELRSSSTARVLALGFIIREGTNAQRNWESWKPKAPSLAAAIRRAEGADRTRGWQLQKQMTKLRLHHDRVAATAARRRVKLAEKISADAQRLASRLAVAERRHSAQSTGVACAASAHNDRAALVAAQQQTRRTLDTAARPAARRPRSSPTSASTAIHRRENTAQRDVVFSFKKKGSFASGCALTSLQSQHP
eukprot:COSAG04_NODE_20_length_39202_cov_9.993530_11_plen_256_part_00